MEARFTGPVRDLLAKRASWHCSNPACGILTVGPTADDATASNLGEAAHIYGARPGSARFRDEMTDAARADVSNGIWLCCTCHKHADDDPLAHPAELLFEWRRQHERAMGMQLGQRLAAKVQDRALAAYPDAGYLAEQIILDRPIAWEFKLTAELLLHLLAPVRRRARNINQGLYAKSLTWISDEEFVPWLQIRMDEIMQQVEVLKNLVENELAYAWGAPGIPGSVDDIYNACLLLRDAADRLLDFEDVVRSARVSDRFKKANALFKGLAVPLIEEIFRVPVFIQKIFSVSEPTGQHSLDLVFALPHGWVEDMQDAFEHAKRWEA
jgi:hypothetical protein